MYLEIWKPIKELNDKYYISNHGRMLLTSDYKKLVETQGNANVQFCQYKIDCDSFCFIDVDNKQLYIHILVASYFIDGYSKDKEVYHRDGNKQNNKVINLRL